MRKLTVLLLALMIGTVSASAEENIDEMFNQVKAYLEAENYSKALEELGWAKNEIEKRHSKKVESFFPDTLEGFTGGSIEATNVMGMSNIERTYTHSDGKRVKTSLIGGSAGGGGLGAFGQMAAMLGASQGQNSFRLNGRTAHLEENEQRNRAELTVSLDSGSMLKFEMNGSSDGALLRKMAQAFDVAALDNYLRGN
jgi:hypothetical protein